LWEVGGWARGSSRGVGLIFWIRGGQGVDKIEDTGPSFVIVHVEKQGYTDATAFFNT
jgi:hypothetical protein